VISDYDRMSSAKGNDQFCSPMFVGERAVFVEVEEDPDGLASGYRREHVDLLTADDVVSRCLMSVPDFDGNPVRAEGIIHGLALLGAEVVRMLPYSVKTTT